MRSESGVRSQDGERAEIDFLNNIHNDKRLDIMEFL